MAGPFTPKAIGDNMPEVDIEQSVQQANAQLNPNSVGVQPTQDTRTAPQDPTQSDPFSLQLRGPQYGRAISNQDIVPHSDPRTITHAGQSFSQPAFQLGYAAVGSRLQEMERQRQDLIKSAQALTAEDNREKVAPQYARSYNSFVDRTQQDFLGSMIARYGSEQRAWEKIAKDPTIRRQWEQLHRDNNEIGRVINYDVGEAEKYLTGVGTGQYRFNPQAVRSSQDLIQGYGQLGAQGLGDLQQLMGIGNEYRKHTTPEYTFNKAGIDDRVAKFAQERYQGLKHDKEGRLMFTTWEQKKDFDTQISQLANEWYPAFADQYSKEEFTQWLHDRYPSQVELHVQSRGIPQPKTGRSGGDKVAAGQLAFSYGLSPHSRAKSGQMGSSFLGASSEDVPTISMSEATSGKFKQLAPRTFDSRTGNITINAPDLRYIDGDWMITGRDISDKDVAKIEETSEQYGADSDEVTKLTQDLSEGQMRYIPASGNTSRLKSYFGNDFSIDKMVAERAAERGVDWDQAAFDKLDADKRQKVMTALFKD